MLTCAIPLVAADFLPRYDEISHGECSKSGNRNELRLILPMSEVPILLACSKGQGG